MVDDTKVIVNIRGVHMQTVLCEKTDVHLKFMCVCTEYSFNSFFGPFHSRVQADESQEGLLDS